MKIGIMQPYFFPYLPYWQLIKDVDKYVVYDDVTYIKGGWINRNNILLNGMSYRITLPLSKPSSFSLIKDISILPDKVVRDKILKTISSAYLKAPHYHEIMPWLGELISHETRIGDLNYKTIEFILDYLGIKTKVYLSSNINKDNSLSGQDKVIEICKRLGGDTYLNASGGRQLYSHEDFDKNGIKLYFLDAKDYGYQQFDNSFIKDLSIIDALMFNSKDELKNLLNKYRLSD